MMSHRETHSRRIPGDYPLSDRGRGRAGTIAFYQKVFGAIELMHLSGPDGKVGHAELMINDSRIMLADEAPQMGSRAPRAFGGSPVRKMMLYVEDVDATAKRAVDAGAKLVRPIEDQFLR